MKPLSELQTELKKLEKQSAELDMEIQAVEDRLGELETEQDKVWVKIAGVKDEIAALTPEETEADKERERQEQLIKQRYGYIPMAISDWWQKG